MNLIQRNKILTIQTHAMENRAVLGVFLLFPCSNEGLRGLRCVIQGPLGCLRYTFEKGWL